MRASPRAAGARLSQRWARLTAATRRRILLGTMLALALAARDLLLFLVAAGTLALAEMAPRPTALPRPS